MGDIKNKMIFRKLGGKYQLLIAEPEDLRFIPGLDEAHWIATGAPSNSFTCDEIFLKHLDSDGNIRIRTDELKNALLWLFSVLTDISILSEKTPSLKLDYINTEKNAGRQIHSAAKRILSNIKAEDKTTISLEQTRNSQQILSSAKGNGDGVITPESLEDEKTIQLINNIMQTVGSADDASGQKGITAELLEKFMAEANAYIQWHDQGTLKKDEKKSPIMIRGEKTVTAYASITAVKSKLDEYFTYCKMLKIDEAIEKRFHPDEKTVNELDMNNPDSMAAYMSSAPLAKPNKELILNLDENINSAYTIAISAFTNNVLPASGKLKQLSCKEWEAVKNEFANFAKWDTEKQGTIVESLGIDLLREYINGKLTKKLKPLFEEDLAVAEEIKQISSVEKLLLFKQFILDFANDFVSLSRLFDPALNSMIQVGRLVMDGRHFDLNVKVEDRAAHKKIAEKSNICVMYLSLISKNGNTSSTMNIATGVTSGNISNLYIGKKGVFFTPDGKEWGTEVVDFIQHPVSVSEALWMPFTKLGAFLKKQTDKFTSSGYKNLEKGVGDGITNVGKTVSAPQPAKTSWTGPLMLLGGGIGIAGLGSAFASVTNALKSISPMQVLLFFIIIVIVVALPIILAAVFKLRKRNIGMFLEACGWAMNSSMRLTYKMGLLFTNTPALPENSKKRYFEQTGTLLKNVNLQRKGWKFKTLMLIITIIAALGIGTLCRYVFDFDKKVNNVVTGAPAEGNR